MKRNILFILLCGMAAGAFAINPLKYHRENYRLHDFGITIGAYDPTSFENDLDDFVLQMRMKYLMDENYCGDGAPGLTISGYYLYNLNDRIGLGATVGWNGMSHYELERMDFHQDENQRWRFDGEAHAKMKARAFHFMPTVKYTWFYNSGISLYVKGSAGIYYRYMGFDYSKDAETIHAPKRDILFAYQATPIGIDFSNGPVRYFMEAGYGASGVFKIGICCKLHRVWPSKAKK